MTDPDSLTMDWTDLVPELEAIGALELTDLARVRAIFAEAERLTKYDKRQFSSHDTLIFLAKHAFVTGERYRP